MKHYKQQTINIIQSINKICPTNRILKKQDTQHMK